MENNNLINESDYFVMPATRETRSAQIPINAERFEYLTKHYTPGKNGSRWIMFHHPGHFMIYDKESRYCIFDGTYATVTDSDLVAVVYDIRICPEEFRTMIFKGDGFDIFANLICEGL